MVQMRIINYPGMLKARAIIDGTLSNVWEASEVA